MSGKPDGVVEAAVARAVHVARFGERGEKHPGFVTLENEDVSGQEYCRRLATAAILATLQAIREPTSEMVDGIFDAAVAYTLEKHPGHADGEDWRKRAVEMPEEYAAAREVFEVCHRAAIDTLIANLKDSPHA